MALDMQDAQILLRAGEKHNNDAAVQAWSSRWALEPASLWSTLIVAAVTLASCSAGVSTSAAVKMPAGIVGPVLDSDGWLNPGDWRVQRGLISPDGTQVAFYGEDPQGNVLVGLSRNGRPTALTKPTISPSDFAWMPDSKTLLIAYRVPPRPRIRPIGVPDRFGIFDLTGRMVRSIHIDRAVTNELEMGMDVSPDGTKAILAATPVSLGGLASDLLLLDLDKGSTRNLTTTADSSETMPVFASQTMVIFIGGTINNGDTPNGWVGVLDTNSGLIRRLTSEVQVVGSASTMLGQQTVIYEAFSADDRNSQGLWKTGLLVGAPVDLHERGVTYPSLYKDGKWVLVTVVDGPGNPARLRLLPIK